MYMIAEVSQYVAVASFAEAWIEIMNVQRVYWWKHVASFAEAWIEIVDANGNITAKKKSPPSRRRGLKFFH